MAAAVPVRRLLDHARCGRVLAKLGRQVTHLASHGDDERALPRHEQGRAVESLKL